MNSTLKKFFDEERKRVFEPGPYFSQRVMAHVTQAVPTTWDFIPRAVRPVMALSLILLFGVLSAQIVMPAAEPVDSVGPVMANAARDLTQDELELFMGSGSLSHEVDDLDLLGLAP
jgi:hypothetical protein